MSDNEQLIRKLRRVYILYRRRVNGNAEAPTDSAGTRHAQGQGKILTALCPLDETEKKQLFSLLEKILSAQSGEQTP